MGPEPTNLLTARLFPSPSSRIVRRRISASTWGDVERTGRRAASRLAFVRTRRDQDVPASRRLGHPRGHRGSGSGGVARSAKPGRGDPPPVANSPREGHLGCASGGRRGAPPAGTSGLGTVLDVVCDRCPLSRCGPRVNRLNVWWTGSRLPVATRWRVFRRLRWSLLLAGGANHIPCCRPARHRCRVLPDLIARRVEQCFGSHLHLRCRLHWSGSHCDLIKVEHFTILAADKHAPLALAVRATRTYVAQQYEACGRILGDQLWCHQD